MSARARRRRGWPATFGARRGEQHEGVAVGELVALARAVVVERPEIAAVAWRRDGARGSPPCRGRRCRRRPAASEQLRDGEAMDHPRGGVQRPRGLGGHRAALVVEGEEAAGRVDRAGFEESEEWSACGREPAPVGAALRRQRGCASSFSFMAGRSPPRLAPARSIAKNLARRPPSWHKAGMTAMESPATRRADPPLARPTPTPGSASTSIGRSAWPSAPIATSIRHVRAEPRRRAALRRRASRRARPSRRPGAGPRRRARSSSAAARRR